jgi:hypothetical protein
MSSRLSALFLAAGLAAAATPAIADDFGFGPDPYGWRPSPWQSPYGAPSWQRQASPQIVCEPGGWRCYRVDAPLQQRGYDWRQSQPWYGQGWRRDPWNARPDPRFARPAPSVVCDQRTSICYKDGHIDKSETQLYFGNSASRRADAIRDRAGTGQVFVPRPGVVCDPDDRKCIRRGGR